ncbi:nicotinate-nucleotide adenylyltransferase [Pseudoluteimonas lycopersici]|uniref:Probable nicotinate-nucleotide adenylyltransferase n=1 Tax=Pseudoluteimonas lycopersici TaxID=1324796 RepID=A0A516V457_9GAMM|nr:nicotinate-nucleotide adenylyltransferase [Lysobacter lycopersici]QDQ73306.1 nicotinate-nucleotide adenylyltransferase [Lysobacter lycopersici]
MLEILYGGSFDPVHLGHLAVARNARDAAAAQVRLMPAADPPHKGPLHADARQRLAMLELAIDGEPGLGIEACELERDGPSYTVDTLRLLRAARVGDRPLAILVGADSFLSLQTWKEWRSLFDLAHVVVAERGGSGFDPSTLPDALAKATAGRWAQAPDELHRLANGLVLRLDQPLRPESASEVRRRIAAGADWQALVPPAVAGYIVENRLYGAVIGASL